MIWTNLNLQHLKMLYLINLNFSGQMNFRKVFFVKIFNIAIHVKIWPPFGPTLLPEIMIWRNYLMKLPFKFQIYWPNGISKSFKFSLFPNYLPLDRVWPFIGINLNPLGPWILCAKLVLNQWFWKRRWNAKSLQQQLQGKRQTTDRFWLQKLTWALGSGGLTTKQAYQLPADSS